MNFKLALLSFGIKDINPLSIFTMLEEKNDNLQEADGEQLNEVNGTLQTDYSTDKDTIEDSDVPVVHETEGQLPFAPKEILESAKVADEPESDEEDEDDSRNY